MPHHTTPTEIWKDIDGYEGYYQVSNAGRVKSLRRQTFGGKHGKQVRGERILKQAQDKDGYLRVVLQTQKEKKTISIHRLVAYVFLPNPANLPQVNHLDGVKTNNHTWNLQWCNRSQNVTHAYKTGLVEKRFGGRNVNAKLTWAQVQVIREAIKHGHQQVDIASYFKVSTWTISRINTRHIRVNQ